jgi:hypothetical protein
VFIRVYLWLIHWLFRAVVLVVEGVGVAGGEGEGAEFVVAVVDEAFDDARGEQAAELVGVSAEGDDLFDEAGGGEAEFFAGHDEDGFDIGDFAVGESDAELVVEVGEVAQATEDGGGVILFGEVDGESGVGLDGDVGEMSHEGAYDAESFFDGEEVLFFAVFADGDDESVEDFAAAFDDVDVAAGDGVEGAGEDGGGLVFLAHRVLLRKRGGSAGRPPGRGVRRHKGQCRGQWLGDARRERDFA